MKFFKAFSVLFMVLCISLVSFTASGCTLVSIDWDINDGYDDEDDYVEADFEFTIEATLSEVTFSISNVGVYGENVTLVALQTWQYLYSESIVGLAEDTSASPTVLATFTGGTATNLTFSRYLKEDEILSDADSLSGTDMIYLKFYVLSSDDSILAGPKYCTEIEPLYTHDEVTTAQSIKGTMYDIPYKEQVVDLGSSYTELNFWITEIWVPNETYNSSTGKVEQFSYVEGTNSSGQMTVTRNGETTAVDYIDYNGTRYYFRLSVLSEYDSLIKYFTENGVKVTLVLLLEYESDKTLQPYYVTYPATANSSGSYVQVNTSNEYGANYWAALMEFFANRYCGKNGYGYANSFILGNEIDMSSTWNNIVGSGQAALTLDDYVEEFERELRIANQAVKKYYANNIVLVSLTHAWTSSIEEYSPKDILDALTKKTLSEGNYDYGLALHPYGMSLTNPCFWSVDTSTSGMTGSLNTTYITWSNLEVIQLYLEQSSKLCNGQIRSVYLTEGGVTSSDGTSGTEMYVKAQKQQAAGVSYIYYKCTHLSCVKALIYYRLVDHTSEGSNFGLMTSDGVEKIAYNVWKYIDTQYSFDVSNEYLQYITWSVTENGKVVSYGTELGNVSSWKDVMGLFASNFDWDANWDETKIMVRTISESEYYG